MLGGSARADAGSLTAPPARFLVDLRPEQLQAFAARVGELAGAAGFTPRTTAGPSETFARFVKPEGVGSGPPAQSQAPPVAPPVSGALPTVLQPPPQDLATPTVIPPPMREWDPTSEPQCPSLTSKGGSGDQEPPAGF